jgi:hypothetical protein
MLSLVIYFEMIILKFILEKQGGSEHGPMKGFCEDGDEHSSFMKTRNFVQQKGD